MFVCGHNLFGREYFCQRFAFPITFHFQCIVTTENCQLSSQLKTFSYPVVSTMLLFLTLGHAESSFYICFFISLLFFILSIPVFVPFLNASSAEKWKKTKKLQIRIQSWEHYALPAARVTFVFAMQVIGNKQFFKVGLKILLKKLFYTWTFGSYLTVIQQSERETKNSEHET